MTINRSRWPKQKSGANPIKDIESQKSEVDLNLETVRHYSSQVLLDLSNATSRDLRLL